MSMLGQILDILIGQKIKSDGVWRVYDESGVEIVDTGGVMWRANPGALLMWPREVVPLPPVAGVNRGRRLSLTRPWVEETAQLTQLHQEDQLVTELLVTLVTKGFFNGETIS